MTKFGDDLKRLGFGNYAEYLQSDHWKDVRKRFYSSKNFHGCCEACRKKVPTQLHHRTYRRLGRERIADLVALCGDCHKRVHQRARSVRSSGESLHLSTRKVIRRRKKKAEKEQEAAQRKGRWEDNEIRRARELMSHI